MMSNEIAISSGNSSTSEVEISSDTSPATSGSSLESPSNCCSICLGKLQNKSFTDGCFHEFCFVCLLEWSKVKAVCPLCKQSFQSIVFNIRSIDDYDQHFLQPEENDSFASPDGRRFRYRSTLTADRIAERQFRGTVSQHEHVNQVPTSSRHIPTRGANYRRRRQAATSDFRKHIYIQGLRVSVVEETSSGRRLRNISPEFFQANPAQTHRLVPWLNRELNALLYNHEGQIMFVLELIMDLIQRYEIGSSLFHEHLRTSIGRHTDHFIHEFINFARSPYDMIGYDRHAVYETLGTYSIEIPESGSSSSSVSSDVVVISPNRQGLSAVQPEGYSQPSEPGAPNHTLWDPTPILERVRNFLSAVDNNIETDTAHSGWESPAPSNITSSPQRAEQPMQHTSSPRSSKVSIKYELVSDSDSDSDAVIFVCEEKAFHERSPLPISSDSDSEIIVTKDKSKKERSPKSRHKKHKSRSRSRHRDRSKSCGSSSQQSRLSSKSRSKRHRSQSRSPRHYNTYRSHSRTREGSKHRSRSSRQISRNRSPTHYHESLRRSRSREHRSRKHTSRSRSPYADRSRRYISPHRNWPREPHRSHHERSPYRDWSHEPHRSHHERSPHRDWSHGKHMSNHKRLSHTRDRDYMHDHRFTSTRTKSKSRSPNRRRVERIDLTEKEYKSKNHDSKLFTYCDMAVKETTISSDSDSDLFVIQTKTDKTKGHYKSTEDTPLSPASKHSGPAHSPKHKTKKKSSEHQEKSANSQSSDDHHKHYKSTEDTPLSPASDYSGPALSPKHKTKKKSSKHQEKSANSQSSDDHHKHYKSTEDTPLSPASDYSGPALSPKHKTKKKSSKHQEKSANNQSSDDHHKHKSKKHKHKYKSHKKSSRHSTREDSDNSVKDNISGSRKSDKNETDKSKKSFKKHPSGHKSSSKSSSASNHGGGSRSQSNIISSNVVSTTTVD